MNKKNCYLISNLFKIFSNLWKVNEKPFIVYGFQNL